MKHLRIALALTALTALATAPRAEESTVAHADTAQKRCPAAWSALKELRPEAWSSYGSAQIDNALSKEQTEAFNAYAAGVLALADYMGAFTGLSDKANHTPAYISEARAKYDLALCLIPSAEDRSKLTALSKSVTQASSADIEAKLFKGFDQFTCMNFKGASEAIFAHDPETLDFASITAKHMRACPAS